MLKKKLKIYSIKRSNNMDILLRIDDILFLAILLYSIVTAAGFIYKKKRIKEELSNGYKVIPDPPERRSFPNKSALILWGIVFALSFFNVLYIVIEGNFDKLAKPIIPFAGSLIFLIITIMKKGEFDDGADPSEIYYDKKGFVLQSNQFSFSLPYYRWEDVYSIQKQTGQSTYVINLKDGSQKKFHVDPFKMDKAEEVLRENIEVMR